MEPQVAGARIPRLCQAYWFFKPSNLHGIKGEVLLDCKWTTGLVNGSNRNPSPNSNALAHHVTNSYQRQSCENIIQLQHIRPLIIP